MNFLRTLGTVGAATVLLSASVRAQGPGGILPTPQDTPNRQGTRGANFLHIGIGGSALGPRMACEALRHLAADGPAVHFVSTVDGSELARLLARLQPETTLFIVASKSFGTQETMSNARSARAWLLVAGRALPLPPPDASLAH